MFILVTSNDALIVAEECAFRAPQINEKIAIFPDKRAESKLHSGAPLSAPSPPRVLQLRGGSNDTPHEFNVMI